MEDTRISTSHIKFEPGTKDDGRTYQLEREQKTSIGTKIFSSEFNENNVCQMLTIVIVSQQFRLLTGKDMKFYRTDCSFVTYAGKYDAARNQESKGLDEIENERVLEVSHRWKRKLVIPYRKDK